MYQGAAAALKSVSSATVDRFARSTASFAVTAGRIMYATRTAPSQIGPARRFGSLTYIRNFILALIPPRSFRRIPGAEKSLSFSSRAPKTTTSNTLVQRSGVVNCKTRWLLNRKRAHPA